MTVNKKAMNEIRKLSRIYECRWGKEPDFSIIPPGCSQESMVTVLKRIVDTGESVLTGWNKVKGNKR